MYDNMVKNIYFRVYGNQPDSLEFIIENNHKDILHPDSIKISGWSNYRTLSLAPILNKLGNSFIMIGVTDNVDTTYTSFTVTVMPGPPKPSISNISDFEIYEDSSKSIGFIVDGSNPDNLEFIKVSDVPNIFPKDSIKITGTGNKRTLTVSPVKKSTGICNLAIKVTDKKDTAITSFIVTVKKFCDVVDLKNKDNFFPLYPNPASDNLTIVFKNTSPQNRIEILNLLGVKVLECTSQEQTTTINVESLPVGVYFLRVGNEAKMFIRN